jgi:hypothetical protein
LLVVKSPYPLRLLGCALGVTTTANGYRVIPLSNEVGVAPPPSMSQLLRRSLRRIATGQHPSAVAKHDQPARILFDAGPVDRSGGLEVGVPIEDLLDAGALTARLEKLDRLAPSLGSPGLFTGAFLPI